MRKVMVEKLIRMRRKGGLGRTSQRGKREEKEDEGAKTEEGYKEEER